MPQLSIDITQYDMYTGGSAGAAGSSAPMEASPSPPAPSFDDVVIDNKKEKLPQIEEKFTKEPEKQEQFKQEHNAPVAPVSNPIFAVGGTGDGSGSSLYGTGSGNGSGTGLGGNGKGNGTGTGTGDGIGSGYGSGQGKRPAIPPELIAAPEPIYPENLRQKNINGKVTVRITVGTDGQVESAEVESSSGYSEMDQAAMEAAWGYRYTTAYNEYGEAVSFRKRVRITFKLR